MLAKGIHKERRLNASLDTLWYKWTTHQGLKSFFGADNLIELRLKGPFEIYFLMENPPGLRGGEGNSILSFLPRKMLSFTWNAPPSIPEVRNHDHKTWVVLQFRELAPNESWISLDHLGWLEGPAWEAAFNYFTKAWDVVLDSLEGSCSDLT